MSDNLTPREIVTNLDKYIVGQDKAKRAVAIALRNRYRRSMLEREMQDEITPKNIIMIGPTGVGKTEIARRLSKLMEAPFVKVEATKFTEVGYVGRDVESMIRDLVEASVRMVKKERMEGIREKARCNAEARLIDLLLPKEKAETPNPFALIFGKPAAPKPDNETKEITVETDEEKQSKEAKRAQTVALLKEGKLEHSVIEIDVADTPQLGIEIAGFDGANMNEILSGILPKKTKKRKVTVGEARKILEGEEAEKLIDMDEVTETAINRAEQRGIIFLDEIDKIAGKAAGNGPDVSREGVQRDILPIVEGTTVQTKYGPVKTDFILFIAAGAFHVSKVSDLIPELQGRFPIKVELESLHKEEFKKILTQPDFAITKQYQAMLSVEGVNLVFTDDAIDKIAEVAQIVNESSENIGARRLYTILENLLDDISYNAGGVDTQVDVVIDRNYVSDHLKDDMKLNLDKYIL